jgi:hypothetical protein
MIQNSFGKIPKGDETNAINQYTNPFPIDTKYSGNITRYTTKEER